MITTIMDYLLCYMNAFLFGVVVGIAATVIIYSVDREVA